MKLLSVIILAAAVTLTGASPMFAQGRAFIVGRGPTLQNAPISNTQPIRVGSPVGMPVASPIAPIVSHPIQPIIASPFIQYSPPQVSIPATVIIVPEGRHVGVPANPEVSDVQRLRRTPHTTIIVPNTTVVLPHAGGVPIIHTFPFAPQPSIVLPSTTVLVSPVETVPLQGSPAVLIQTDAPKRNIRPPAVGTSRADVIFQLGRPIGTAGTPSTETLFFEGGVVVVLQDGRVTTIR